MDETPTVEVRVFLDGELVRTEFCESEEQAALVLETWADVEGVHCEVGDLSAHPSGDGFEPDALELQAQDTTTRSTSTAASARPVSSDSSRRVRLSQAEVDEH